MSLLNSFAAASEAKYLGLSLPAADFDGRLYTQNDMGSMLPKINQDCTKFIEIAANGNTKVLEIGPAYGLVCLESLKRGASNYTAIDIERKHLTILARQVEEQVPSKLSSLRLIVGSWPDSNTVQHLEENSFDAILLSMVMHFFDSNSMRESFYQFNRLLKPGGRLIATTSTIYVAFIKESAITTFNLQLDQFLSDHTKNDSARNTECMAKLPGFVEDVRRIVNDRFTPEELDLYRITTGHVFLLNQESLKWLCEIAELIVEDCSYRSVPLPHPFALDGRECLALHAKKTHLCVNK